MIHPEHDGSTADEFDAWLAEPVAALVAEFAEPAHLDRVLARVKAAGVRRRVARRMVTGPAGGVLTRHALVEVARYFRRERPGEVDLLQVSRATGVPLDDSRAVLRHFVAAGMVTERVQANPRGGPPRRLYEVTAAGGTLAGEVVAQADELMRARGAERRIGEVGWEGV